MLADLRRIVAPQIKHFLCVVLAALFDVAPVVIGVVPVPEPGVIPSCTWVVGWRRHSDIILPNKVRCITTPLQMFRHARHIDWHSLVPANRVMLVVHLRHDVLHVDMYRMAATVWPQIRAEPQW